MERILDYLFLGNFTNIAVSCPQELLNKFNNGSNIRKITFITYGAAFTLPATPLDSGFLGFLTTLFNQYEDSKIYFYYVGIFLLTFMLLLNRKRFIPSLALRLFTNYYFGSLLLQFLFVICHVIMTELIWKPLKNKYVWCIKKYPTYEVYYPGRYEEYLIVYDIYLQNISAVYQGAIKHMLPIFLILHRATTYYACAKPFIFKRYFNNKNLKICYPFIGVTIYVLHFIGYKIAITSGDTILFNGYNRYINIFALLLSLIHIVMAVYSVRIVIKFQKSSKIEMQEFKSFLGFSMGPVIVSILEQILLLSSHYLWTFNYSFIYFNFTWMFSIISNILYDIQPEYLCVLYFFFVPFYRKILYRVFCCFKCSSKTEVQILSTTNI